MKENLAKETINLKYPVLLVHGAGFRDTVLGINYWGRIPRTIEKIGIKVFYGGTDSWGTIENNAQMVKKNIEKIIKETGTGKFNVIAHSRGGLEVRYLISSLKLHDRVASLTTISTPHHGVKAMNIALRLPKWLYQAAAFFVNTVSAIMGDVNPDFYTGSRQLSEKICSRFNTININNETVYYQSYAAQMKYFFSDIVYIILNPFLNITDGENDGLCPVESAKWGNFRGVVSSGGLWGISHSGIIDAYKIKYKGVDIPALYLTILKDLATRGY